ncbi:MAG: YqeG family HAD IIIA-type phosphatase [Clostridia bacterium]|nr:YqeG family HAD IIIA-type phosphatase [Clostridia bacterium]
MLIYPKFYCNNVREVTLDFLQKNNIKGIILDVDNTLVDFYKKFEEGTIEWVQNLKQAGIKFCIVSNTNKVEKVTYVAKTLDVPYFYFSKKPLKTGFLKAKKEMGLESKNIAAIGDQIMTDVIGANRCKMFSILVKPIAEKDIFITKIKRPIENKIIDKYLKKIKKEKV